MRNMPSPDVRPVSPRPQIGSHQEHMGQQQSIMASFRSNVDSGIANGSKLWHQMMIGFTCAGSVGLIMLVLGTVFIAEAFGRQQPITVMLCVMGIVFGIIILVGTFILGRLLISRKWVRCQGERNTVPQLHCFHTCSVIYSPSLDQLGASESMLEPPPPYDSVVPMTLDRSLAAAAVDTQEHYSLEDYVPVMILPPKYDEVTEPLPDYVEEQVSTKLS